MKGCVVGEVCVKERGWGVREVGGGGGVWGWEGVCGVREGVYGVGEVLVEAFMGLGRC